jgi:hypothetical protein
MDPNNTIERERFGELMAAMAAALPKDLDKLTISVYRRSLMDIPIERLAAAVGLMVNELTMFPVPSKWREYVDLAIETEEAAERQRVRALLAPPEPEGTEPEPYYDCNVCLDSGWETFICDPNATQPRYATLDESGDAKALDWSKQARRQWCGRKHCKEGRTEAHSFTQRCPCYETNPTIKRRLAALTKERYAKPKRGREPEGELRG